MKQRLPASRGSEGSEKKRYLLCFLLGMVTYRMSQFVGIANHMTTLTQIDDLMFNTDPVTTTSAAAAAAAAGVPSPPSYYHDDIEKGEAVAAGAPTVIRNLTHELEAFLKAHPHSPGAHFIRMLQANIYDDIEEELQRLGGCKRMSNSLRCFAGSKTYNQVIESGLVKGRDKDVEEQTMPFHIFRHPSEQPDFTSILKMNHSNNTKNGEPFLSVYEVRHYSKGPLVGSTPDIKVDISANKIPFLDTQKACLPLFLAAAAVVEAQADPKGDFVQDQTGDQYVVAEMGPFFGLSSKCIASGLQYNLVEKRKEASSSSMEPISYVAFDTYNGNQNLNAAEQFLPISTLFPKTGSSSTRDTSFQFLWERGVHSVYPSAQAVAGYLEPDSGSPTVLERAANLHADSTTTMAQMHIGMMSIDSIKSAKHWKPQLKAVLGSNETTIPAGTILFLMDFDFSADQMCQVYGCLRRLGFLAPVYLSWTEHWAFVVMRDYSLDDPTVSSCFRSISENETSLTEQKKLILQQVEADLHIMTHGFLGQSRGVEGDPLQVSLKPLLARMKEKFASRTLVFWKNLAHI